MTDLCPFCRQELPTTDVLLYKDDRYIAVGGHSIRLRPMEIKIMSTLYDSWPRVAPRWLIMANMHVLEQDQPDSENAVDVHMVRIRRSIEGTGLSIESTRGEGYRLVIDPSLHLVSY